MFDGVVNVSLDTGRKLNLLDAFWTSYVRSIYILCPQGHPYVSVILQLKRSVFKVGFSRPEKNCFICFDENPLKMMKMIFILP